MATKAVTRGPAGYNPLEMVTVASLRRAYTYPSGGPRYGPSGGPIEVPRGLADSMGLSYEGAGAGAGAETPEAPEAKRKR